MKVDLNKPLDEKNIVEKFTNSENGQFKVGSAFIYLENKVKEQETRIAALEEAMQFFSEWYNKTQRVEILVPDTLKDELDNKGPKIIL